jgi:hypothetical protein
MNVCRNKEIGIRTVRECKHDSHIQNKLLLFYLLIMKIKLLFQYFISHYTRPYYMQSILNGKV